MKRFTKKCHLCATPVSVLKKGWKWVARHFSFRATTCEKCVLDTEIKLAEAKDFSSDHIRIGLETLVNNPQWSLDDALMMKVDTQNRKGYGANPT